MITKIVIKDNKKSPINNLHKIKAFKNGAEFTFNPGVNVIIGENGCGKTTLLNLIRKYLIVGYEQCEKGPYSKNIFNMNISDFDGVDVFADYDKNTFNMMQPGDRANHQDLRSGLDFILAYKQMNCSTGESIMASMESMFNLAFCEDAKLKFDYEQFNDNYPEYYKYIQNHRVKDCPNEWTFIMDEPDRNLSLKYFKQIKGILSYHKENTQIITVLHNPLLIYWAIRQKHINIIELSKGYKNKICKIIDSINKKNDF